MAKRFSVGDMARVVVAAGTMTLRYLNQEVEVIFVTNEDLHVVSKSTEKVVDYACRAADGVRFCCMDYQLQPINPPKEPDSMTRKTENEEELTA